MKIKLVLLVALSWPGWTQNWEHRVWNGEMWGEPASLEEWSGPQGYQRKLSFTGFPWSEWSVLQPQEGGFQVDCNGRRRKLEGASLRSLFVRWYLDSEQWRKQPLPDLKVVLDDKNRPASVDFVGNHQVWDYSQGMAFQESEPSFERPQHFQLVVRDQQSPPTPPEHVFSAPSAELPLSLVGERWTQLSVMVAGKPELFLLDSGATNNVIDKSLVAQAGWPRVGRQKLSGGLFDSVGWAQVPMAQVAGQDMQAQNWLELDLQGSDFAKAFPGVRGILGYDFLSQYTVQIDYPAARLRLLAGPFRPGPQDLEVAVRREGLGMAVAVEVAGTPGYLTLDTGSGGGILIHHLPGQTGWVSPANRDLYDPEGASFGSGKAGTWPGRANFKLGPFEWVGAPLEVVDEKSAQGASLLSDGNLGVAYLRHFRITMDVRDGRLWMAQIHPFRSPHRATFGLRLKPQGDIWLVSTLPVGGPAARAGLLKGDQLLQINGLPPQGLPTSEFLDGARAGEVLRVTVQRQGKPLSFQFKARAVDP